jgi:hypothetical protein
MNVKFDGEIVYRTVIHLGDNEWGNQMMAFVAQKYLDVHPELDPLEVEVCEHAGWHLTFTRDIASDDTPGFTGLSVVVTANDAACLSQKAREFNKEYYYSERKLVDSIRRPIAACKRCGRKDVEIIEKGLCRCCRFPT